MNKASSFDGSVLYITTPTPIFVACFSSPMNGLNGVITCPLSPSIEILPLSCFIKNWPGYEPSA